MGAKLCIPRSQEMNGVETVVSKSKVLYNSSSREVLVVRKESVIYLDAMTPHTKSITTAFERI